MLKVNVFIKGAASGALHKYRVAVNWVQTAGSQTSLFADDTVL